MQSPFAYKCGAQETAAPKQQNSPANPHDSAELQLLGQTEYFNFQNFSKKENCLLTLIIRAGRQTINHIHLCQGKFVKT